MLPAKGSNRPVFQFYSTCLQEDAATDSSMIHTSQSPSLSLRELWSPAETCCEQSLCYHFIPTLSYSGVSICSWRLSHLGNSHGLNTQPRLPPITCKYLAINETIQIICPHPQDIKNQKETIIIKISFLKLKNVLSESSFCI